MNQEIVGTEMAPSAEAAPAPWLPEKSGRRRKRRPSAGHTLAVIALILVTMVGSLAWAAATGQESTLAHGPMVADHTTHRIARVQAGMPAPSVRFWLRAWGAPLVTEVSTDLPCASARLVQGGVKSQWFGIGSEWSDPSAYVQIQPFLPVYLEVRINPTAHSLDGRVALDHKVLVKTADGQLLSFDVDTAGNRPGVEKGDN